jgi:hypothetical protein
MGAAAGAAGIGGVEAAAREAPTTTQGMRVGVVGLGIEVISSIIGAAATGLIVRDIKGEAVAGMEVILSMGAAAVVMARIEITDGAGIEKEAVEGAETEAVEGAGVGMTETMSQAVAAGLGIISAVEGIGVVTVSTGSTSQAHSLVC